MHMSILQNTLLRAKKSLHQAWHSRRSLRYQLLAAVLVVSACTEIPEPIVDELVKPTGPKPAWAPDIDPQMLAVIEQLQSFNTPPLTTLSAQQARKAPTPTDAVEKLLQKNNITPAPPNVDISHKVIPGPAPEGILVRIYTPKNSAGPFPVIVYYHGGGWVIAGLDTYEPSASALADKSGAIVVSVAYRQAPEHKFPAAHEDAFAAFRWALDNAASINGDPKKVATAGESAGGNLAVAVALMARERGVKLPVHMLSVYPIADGDVQSPSYDQYASALPLNRPLMQWFFDKYLRNAADAEDPLISLIEADLDGLPATTVINAQIDPLLHEGGVLAERMAAAGVQVKREVYQGVTHEFFGMAAVLDQARKAQSLAADELKKAFAAVK